MKRMLLILMVLASVTHAGVLHHHDDDCYVSNDKCKLYDLINIRSGWRVFIPSALYHLIPKRF